MHTEIYCDTLDKLDSVKAIRAIQQAWLQLRALNDPASGFDNAPAMKALEECLIDAGHIGFKEI